MSIHETIKKLGPEGTTAVCVTLALLGIGFVLVMVVWESYENGKWAKWRTKWREDWWKKEQERAEKRVEKEERRKIKRN